MGNLTDSDGRREGSWPCLRAQRCVSGATGLILGIGDGEVGEDGPSRKMWTFSTNLLRRVSLG